MPKLLKSCRRPLIIGLSAAALLATGLSLAGCRDPFIQRSNARTMSLESRANASAVPHDQYAEIGYRLDWRGYPAISRRQTLRDIAVLPTGDLAAIETGSTVSLIEGDTGRLRWQNRVSNELARFVGVVPGPAGDVLAIGETEVHFLDAATGTITDRQRFRRLANTKPVIRDAQLIYGTSTGKVASHLTVQGVPLWAFSSTGAFEAKPVEVGGRIGSVSRDGAVVFLSPDGGLVGGTKIFRGPAAGTHPVASGDILYTGSLDQSVYAFDTEGNELWRHRTPEPITQQPALIDGTLYIETDKGLTALDGFRGDVRWANAEVVGEVLLRRAGLLLVWDAERGTMTAVDPADGAIVRRVELRGIADFRVTNTIDGDLYAITDANVVCKFIPIR